MKNIIKKNIFFVLLIIFSLQGVLAKNVEEIVPYKENEFPEWAKDLRRAEIITLGSWPFTTLLTTLGFSVVRYVQNGFSSDFIPNPFVKTSGAYTMEQQTQIILTSALISVGIGLTDLIFHIVKRNSKKNKAQQISENIKITPMSDFNTEYLLDQKKSDYLYGSIESALF